MPQRQITKPADARELPDLTGQQQEFVRHLLAGKTGADAYRLAYDCSNSSSATIIAHASRLRADANVSAWLAAGREAHLGTAILTRESHMAELERLKEIAIKTGNVGAAVQAEQLRGKVAGHQVDRIADVTAEQDPFEMLRAIARDMGEDVAKQAAAKSGLTWPIPAKLDREGATKH